MVVAGFPAPLRTDYRVKLWPSGHWASWQVRRAKHATKPKIQTEYEDARNKAAAHGAIALLSADKKAALLNGFINRREISQSAKVTPERRPCLGLTGYMRRLIQSACKVLEAQSPLGTTAFLTCTMPVTDRGEVEQFLKAWPEIQRRYCERLRRKLIQEGLPGELVWVTELQDKRGFLVGYPCPHLHILFQGRHSEMHDWALSKSWVKETWASIIFDVCGIGVVTSASTRIEQVRKSCARYMSKYLSKGRGGPSLWIGTPWESLLPKRFGRVSNQLRESTLSQVKRLLGEGAFYFVQDQQQLADQNQIAITFQQYGTTAGFILDDQTFEASFDYYESLEEYQKARLREQFRMEQKLKYDLPQPGSGSS